MDNPQNQDDILGMNMPRGSYSLGGYGWRLEEEGAPMIINSITPGVGVNRESDDWAGQYGASHDAFLTLVDGQDVKDAIDDHELGASYTSMPHTASDNIWESIEGSNQIQYVVSGGSIAEGETMVEGWGGVEAGRGIGIRLPMMGVGYGRTKEMRDLFTDKEKMDRTEWKTGSIDTRWDEKRRTWATYNDLIVDHEGEELGTAVFSTNPDADEGFPFLKGRLEDVWWVRQPIDLDGADGDKEGASSARIMTHLEHEFYDDEEKGAAPLNSLFIVPFNSLPALGTPDVCFTQNEENKLGSEITGEGDAIAILTEAGFWFDSDKYGPIKFGQSVSELGEKLCCTNSNSKMFVGEMIFVDEAVPDCNTEPGDVGADEDTCVWVPAISIDECELVGAHFNVFFDNDKAVAEATHGICMGVYDWSQGLSGQVFANDAALKDAITCNNDEIRKVAATLLQCIKENAAYTTVLVQNIYADMQAAFDLLVAQIVAAFLVCCDCEAPILSPLLGNNDMGVIVPGKKIIVDDCDANIGGIDPFDCNNCVTIELNAPCATNQDEGPFRVGLPCGSSTIVKEPDYTNVGGCQTHTGA